MSQLSYDNVKMWDKVRKILEGFFAPVQSSSSKRIMFMRFETEKKEVEEKGVAGILDRLSSSYGHIFNKGKSYHFIFFLFCFFNEASMVGVHVSAS